MVGCSDDKADPAVSVEADTGQFADSIPAPPVCDANSEENFLILFGYRGAIDKQDLDIRMIEPQQTTDEKKLTDFSLKEEGKTCQKGCEVDAALRWIAVADVQNPDGGRDFQIGKFNDCLEVALVKGGELEGVRHLEFQGDYAYYSQQVPGCTGASCQYSVTRMNLNAPAERTTLINAFPPADDPDWVNGDSTYKGYFHVSPDGESLVILSPTIRSQRVYIWKKGAIAEVDYLCDNFQNETCIGTGSQYSDRDPVAISPDSSEVIIFAVNKRALRAIRYSTENFSDRGSTALLAVDAALGGDYANFACIAREPWQYTQIVGTPTYTPDGQHVLFIGRAPCFGADGNEPLTNILKIDPSWIGDLTPLEESELLVITDNTEQDITTGRAIDISAMALSPDGKRVVVTATPRLNSQFAPRTAPPVTPDKEVYMLDVCGGSLTQLTADLSYSAESPLVVPRPELGQSCSPLFGD
jgi:hypothetical protein